MKIIRSAAKNSRQYFRDSDYVAYAISNKNGRITGGYDIKVLSKESTPVFMVPFVPIYGKTFKELRKEEQRICLEMMHIEPRIAWQPFSTTIEPCINGVRLTKIWATFSDKANFSEDQYF